LDVGSEGLTGERGQAASHGNPNAGLPVNDPRSPDIAAGNLPNPDGQQYRTWIDEETGHLMTDAPEPAPPAPKVARRLELDSGPNVNEKGEYGPAMYPISRKVRGEDGKMFHHEAIREDR
jgi:hypothetical protein